MLVYQHDGRFPPCQRHSSRRPNSTHTRVQIMRSNLHRWRGLADGSNLMCQSAVRHTLFSEKTFGCHLSPTPLSPWRTTPIRETNVQSLSALATRPPSHGFTFWRKDRKGSSGAHHAVALKTAGGHIVSDLAWLGSSGESAGEAAEVGERMWEHEMARRRKISIANKNKVPWNKGRKWSDEMKDKIRNNTRIAMQNPEIRLRLQQNAQKQGSKLGMSPEIRAKISAGVLPHNRTRTAVSQARKQVLSMWQAAIGQAAQQGGPGEVGLEWVTSRTIKYVGDIPLVPKPPRVTHAPKKARGGPRGPRSEEHRKRIADAIREKWMDPSYRERVLGGMAVMRETGTTTEPPRRKYRKRSPPSPTSSSSSSSSTSTRRKRASPQIPEDPIVFEGIPPTADPAFLAAVMEGDGGVEEEEEGPLPRKLVGGRFTKVKIVSRLGEREAGEAVGSGSTETGLDMLEEVWREHEEVKRLREAAQEGLRNARILMAEAQRATEALTSDDDEVDEQTAASLAEAQQYLEAAAQQIAEAESLPCEPTTPAGIFSLPIPSTLLADGADGARPHHRALFRAALAGEGSEEEQAEGMKLLAECFGTPLEFSQAERMRAFEAAHGWVVKESKDLRERQRREEGLGGGGEVGGVDGEGRVEGEGGEGEV